MTLVEGTGAFALGPLSEVAASTHPWAELVAHVVPGLVSTLAAHERVVRGEVVAGGDRLDPAVLDLPLALERWEPAYAGAVYRPDGAEFPSPPLPSSPVVGLPVAGRVVAHTPVTEALAGLVRPWRADSDGSIAVTAVKGRAGSAVAALGHDRVQWSRVDAGDALARMAWAGASGGAHGRRRGAAVGRFGAWWALAALADRLDDWPVPPTQLGQKAARLQWALWHPVERSAGSCTSPSKILTTAWRGPSKPGIAEGSAPQ